MKSTEKMFNIMSNVYLSTCGRKVEFADLGQSTKCFGFFVTYSINATISQTSLRENLDGMMKLSSNYERREITQ